jgi:carbohydrate-selective porin OprB
MFVRSIAFFVSTIVCILLTFTCTVTAQQLSATPSSKPDFGTSDEKRNDPSAGQKPEAAPAPSPEFDFWHRETMTDDWGGTRARWKEHGLDMQFTLTGFVQGTTSGGLRRDSELNGKFESKFNLDFEKLWGWKYWSAETKVEYRFGGPVLSGIGAINTVIPT